MTTYPAKVGSIHSTKLMGCFTGLVSVSVSVQNLYRWKCWIIMNQYYSFYPDKAYFRELIRPWKLLTFCIAMALLLYGALNLGIGDWDVGVTLLMGCLTYLLAPWSVYIFVSAVRYRPSFWYLQIVAAIIAGIFVVDWAYMLYHTMVGNVTFRSANLYASAPIYIMAGVFWLYRGSLKELLDNIQKLRLAARRWSLKY